MKRNEKNEKLLGICQRNGSAGNHAVRPKGNRFDFSEFTALVYPLSVESEVDPARISQLNHDLSTPADSALVLTPITPD